MEINITDIMERCWKLVVAVAALGCLVAFNALVISNVYYGQVALHKLDKLAKYMNMDRAAIDDLYRRTARNAQRIKMGRYDIPKDEIDRRRMKKVQHAVRGGGK